MIPSVEAVRAAADAVRSRIEQAARASGRDPSSVTLVAVTKGVPEAIVSVAAAAGLSDLGENYAQDLERRRPLAPDARWHFLGRVQSNKARTIAAAAALVHGLEPGRAARRLGEAGHDRGRPVRGLLQVDFTGRRQGVAPTDVPAALDELAGLEGLVLDGLMTVAPLDDTDPRRWFAALRQLRDRHAPELRELSMGMSADFQAAVEEGATMVRVGTALFGARAPRSAKET